MIVRMHHSTFCTSILLLTDLYGLPVQYREVQGHESTRFLSYFPRFLCLQGGVATGFHHVSALPPLDIRKLYRITLAREAGRSSLIVREVPAEGTSLVRGDVFVLDKGNQVWQYNTKASAGQERYKAAEFVQSLINERKGQCDLTVYGRCCSATFRELDTHVSVLDEEGHRAGNFLSEFGLSTFPPDTAALVPRSDYPALLFRLSDSTGHITFEPITPVAPSTLSTDDVFLLDAASTESPAIYVWIGKRASHLERRLSFQYAQIYLYKKRADGEIVQLMTTLVKILEGGESDAFRKAMVSNT
jgi:gelsolin